MKANFKSLPMMLAVGYSLAVVCCASAGEEPIDFQTQIKPLLSDRCFKCHGPDADHREADLRLDTQEGAFASLYGELHVIAPGDLENSELIARIESDDESLRMPPVDDPRQLSPAEIDLIKRWVEQGATWEQHWSFGPLRESDPPKTAGDNWSTNEIDAYILARMEAAGLSPNEPASKERLLRRLSFDLTGLPPTLDELDRFLADESPDAYEEWVDELLGRTTYGERMAADWLDIARYSDSYGYQVDRDRFVWPWRDWVIRSFNDNLPYDQFATWQIAGDLLPDASDDQRLATTFSRLHSQKVEGGSVPEEFRTEYVADRTHTFATAFLGLTFECARCHDHKYDPISQREYYSLYAYFNNIDEAGLYAYFNESVPTPTMRLMDDGQQQRLQELEEKVKQAEERHLAYQTQNQEAAEQWQANFTEEKTDIEVRQPIKLLDFENDIAEPNRSVAGKVGQGVQLTGDDGVAVGVGNFARSQPFSVSFWMKTPDVKERAVLFHRSRAWTDAASRGYELLLVEGRLRWSLIHFWPGNAISIESNSTVPVDQWLQVVVTYDGSADANGLSIYVDGELLETSIIRNQLTKNMTGGGGDTITIGERFRDRGFAKGTIDEFAVYDVCLTSAEISKLASPSEAIDWEVNDRRHELIEYYFQTRDEELSKLATELQAARRELHDFENGLTEIMTMRELPTRRETRLLIRGAYTSPGDLVQPGTPAALPAYPADAPRDRLGLAKWLTGPAHPLAARVAVNHYWQMIFGRGLVRTPEDFGNQGDYPTHPQLLDWLAKDFVDHGWDVKRLLKKIVMSSTYRQDAGASSEASRIDAENRWLSYSPRYRLPAEMLRDQALKASSLMVTQMGGPPVRPYEVTESFKPVAHDQGEGLYRRSVYTYWKRTGPAPVMMALDASKRDVCVVKREQTATPLQSLVMLNDPQLVEAGRELASRLLLEHDEANAAGDTETDNRDAILIDLFRTLTSRYPDEKEAAILRRMYDQQLEHFAANLDQANEYLSVGVREANSELAPDRLAALSLVAVTLLNFDECTTRR